MKVGAAQKVTYDDLTVTIKLPWGKYRQMVAEAERLRKAEDNHALLTYVGQICGEVITQVEGLTDEEGNQVAWRPELVDELPPHVIQGLFEAIMDPARDRDAANPSPK